MKISKGVVAFAIVFVVLASIMFIVNFAEFIGFVFEKLAPQEGMYDAFFVSAKASLFDWFIVISGVIASIALLDFSLKTLTLKRSSGALLYLHYSILFSVLHELLLIVENVRELITGQVISAFGGYTIALSVFTIGFWIFVYEFFGSSSFRK
ncbi:hypothetical protein HY486_02630 [Candidatus Woesearchaeota archaeon]|nr:hypothetical protein [Candidatus Woesearchaeota archaeon]